MGSGKPCILGFGYSVPAADMSVGLLSQNTCYGDDMKYGIETMAASQKFANLKHFLEHIPQSVIYTMITKATAGMYPDTIEVFKALGFKHVATSSNPVHDHGTYLHLYVWHNPRSVKAPSIDDMRKLTGSKFWNATASYLSSGCGDVMVNDNYVGSIAPVDVFIRTRDAAGRFNGVIRDESVITMVDGLRWPAIESFNRAWVYWIGKSDLSRLDPRWIKLAELPSGQLLWAGCVFPVDESFKRIKKDGFYPHEFLQCSEAGRGEGVGIPVGSDQDLVRVGTY